MVPDDTTKYYKNVGRYLLHRDSLTNANAKKYYSQSDWKILTRYWNKSYTKYLSIIKILVSCKTWSFTNSCFVGDSFHDICRYSAVDVYWIFEILGSAEVSYI